MLFSLHFWKMLWIKDRPRSPNEFYQGIKYLYGSFWISSFLSSHKYIFKQGSVFYSYWFNHTPLGLGWRIRKMSIIEILCFTLVLIDMMFMSDK